MTQGEKAKAYDKAIERANELLYVSDKESLQRKTVEHIFPELKESEDERIRKELIKGISKNRPNTPFLDTNITREEALAWLEKQGEQKPTDKVEPKFKNGQWIVWQNKCYKVNYNGCGYELIDQNGLSTSLEYVTVDENAHLWTIQDAKDGDVLVSSDASYIVIFGGLSYLEDNIDRFKSYCHYSKDIFSPIEDPSWCCNAFHPATKEQRDQLEKAINDAGYTFDFEKKELKKIEQKPAEIELIKMIIEHFRTGVMPDLPQRVKIVTSLKSLKNRVQQQPKQKWSEEDEKLQRNLIRWQEEWLSSQKNGGYMDNENLIKSIEESISWLHHIKDRVQPQQLWKPSEEQIKTCKEIYADILSAKGFDLGTINSDLNRLEEELKKLKE